MWYKCTANRVREREREREREQKESESVYESERVLYMRAGSMALHTSSLTRVHRTQRTGRHLRIVVFKVILSSVSNGGDGSNSLLLYNDESIGQLGHYKILDDRRTERESSIK